MPKKRSIFCPACKEAEFPLPSSQCPSCKKEKARSWYRENAEKYAIWRSNWRTNNREYYSAHQSAYHKKYRSENLETINERWRDWKKANPEMNRAARKRWRTNRRSVWLEQRKRGYSRKTYGEFSEAHRALREFISAMKED